jgi:hypothetical protein
MNWKCSTFLRISFTLYGQLVWVQKCLKTLCQRKCCRSKVLLIRSIELKKKSSRCNKIIDNKSKNLGSESLHIRFMGFFVLNESSTKVNVPTMQVMRWVMCHFLIILQSSHNSTKFPKSFYLTTLNMVSSPWRNMFCLWTWPSIVEVRGTYECPRKHH